MASANESPHHPAALRDIILVRPASAVAVRAPKPVLLASSTSFLASVRAPDTTAFTSGRPSLAPYIPLPSFFSTIGDQLRPSSVAVSPAPARYRSPVMFGPIFLSRVVFGDQDPQSQTTLGTTSLFAHNSCPSGNSNASSNRTRLSSSALFGYNPRPSSTTSQIAVTPDATQATSIPVEKEPREDIMDHDATQSDHADNESESDFGEDLVLNSAKIATILAYVLPFSADSAAAATNAQSCIGRLSGEILALWLSNQSFRDQFTAIKAVTGHRF